LATDLYGVSYNGGTYQQGNVQDGLCTRQLRLHRSL
jgi:hypothetical protein